MRRRTLHACALAALGTLLLPAACAKSDTILLIEISGPRRTAAGDDFVPWQFLATITAGTDARAFTLPMPHHPSPLPQSFSVALDRAHSGPVTVSIVAYSEQQQEIGYGTTVQQHIVIGGQTVIAVALTEAMSTDGTDGGTSDAGTGEDAGADAADGATGQDAPDAQADGPDAKADGTPDVAGDRMGLDTGTD